MATGMNFGLFSIKTKQTNSLIPAVNVRAYHKQAVKTVQDMGWSMGENTRMRNLQCKLQPNKRNDSLQQFPVCSGPNSPTSTSAE